MTNHFFYPSASTSQKSTGVVTQASEFSITGASPVQATGDVAASMTPTQPVEAPSTKMRGATQPVEAPGGRIATQPVEALGARDEVKYQPTGTGSEIVRPVEQSFTSKKSVPATATGVSDTYMTNTVNQTFLLVLVIGQIVTQGHL